MDKDTDNEYSIIDSTIGQSVRDFSTKIYATCNALGNPTGFHFTVGQDHDLVGTDALMDEMTKA